MEKAFHDIYREIADKLDFTSILKFATTNKAIYEAIMKNNFFWEKLLLAKYNYVPKNPQISLSRIYKERFYSCQKMDFCVNTLLYIDGSSVISTRPNKHIKKITKFSDSDPPIHISFDRHFLILTRKGYIQSCCSNKNYRNIPDYTGKCRDISASGEKNVILTANNYIKFYSLIRGAYRSINMSRLLPETNVTRISVGNFIFFLCQDGRSGLLDYHKCKICKIYKPPSEGEKFTQIVAYWKMYLALSNKNILYRILNESIQVEQTDIIYFSISRENWIITAVTTSGTIKYKDHRWREFSPPKMENDMIVQVLSCGFPIVGLTSSGKIVTLRGRL